MNYRIKTTKSFDKEIKRLGKHYASIANDYAALLDELAQNPRLGIDLGSGLPQNSYADHLQRKG